MDSGGMIGIGNLISTYTSQLKYTREEKNNKHNFFHREYNYLKYLQTDNTLNILLVFFQNNMPARDQ
jgi:hypothetical protein